MYKEMLLVRLSVGFLLPDFFLLMLHFVKSKFLQKLLVAPHIIMFFMFCSICFVSLFHMTQQEFGGEYDL